MKKTILLLLALIGWGVAQAQTTDQITATLQNGDNTTIFYGIDALKSAVAAAPENGGIITLSSGVFNNPGDITKSLRIYGMGFENDTTSREPLVIVPKTVVNSDLSFKVNADGIAPANVQLEGLWCNGSINTTEAAVMDRLKVVKCSFHRFNLRNDITNSIIRQCYVRESINGESKKADNLLVENSWLSWIDNFTSESTILVNHCILTHSHYYQDWLGRYHYANCYINRHYAYSYTREGGSFYNCIFPSGQPNNSTAINCWYHVSPEKVFGTNLDYHPAKTWALLNAEQYVGNDGTPVGPQGGDHPWNFISSLPSITQSNVATKTTTDGKLHISLKAEARPATE